MADRWNDERENWRDRDQQQQRYRRETYGARDRDGGYRSLEGDDYGSGDYGRRDQSDRSFQPRQTYGQDRSYGEDRGGGGRVFGERESGADYTGSRSGAGAQYNSRGGYGGGGDQSYRVPSQGGRSYGERDRTGAQRDGYRPGQPAGNPYGLERDRSGGRNDVEHAYRTAYGARHADHEGHYESGRNDRDRDDGRRGFWERAGERVASWFGDFDPEGRRWESSDWNDGYRDGQGYRDRNRDAYDAGHRGRGPTGYKRADERINDEAHERLTDDPWIDASAISISVSSGEVTLSGTVPEREAKHRAERLIESLSGVNHVQNNLRVQRANFLTDPGRGFGDSANTAQIGGAAAASDAAKGRTN